MPRPPRTKAPLSAAARGVRLLTRREHGARELKAKLTRQGIDEVEAGAAVERLTREGWQSDARYAQAVIRTRAGQGYGLLRVEFELSQAGVARDVIDAALAEEAVDWDAVARAVWTRRFEPARDARERARQYRFMASRGFSGEQTRRVAGEIEIDPGD